MIDENTPTNEYAPFRDLSHNWIILNPNDIDFPAVLRVYSFDEENVYLSHETFKDGETISVYKSDILRNATEEEIYSDTPNYDIWD